MVLSECGAVLEQHRAATEDFHRGIEPINVFFAWGPAVLHDMTMQFYPTNMFVSFSSLSRQMSSVNCYMSFYMKKECLISRSYYF